MNLIMSVYWATLTQEAATRSNWRANFTHLKREFVLLFIAEGPDIAANILQVILHKSDHS